MPAPQAPNPYLAPVRRIARLRQLLAMLLLAAAAAVIAIYFWQGRTQRRSLDRRPELRVPQLGLDVQQSAAGVTISKSVAGRPLFRITAAHADKLRAAGHDRLRQVRIQVFANDGVHVERGDTSVAPASRGSAGLEPAPTLDISGSAFDYDEAAGELTADGSVQILLPSPAPGAAPVAITAQSIAYNVKQATGSISGGLAFTVGSANGSAGAAQLDAHLATVKISGGVHMRWKRALQPDVLLDSQQALLHRFPAGDADAATVELSGDAHLRTGSQSLLAPALQVWLRSDGSVRHMTASGGVDASDTTPARAIAAQAQAATADFSAGRDRQALTQLVLTGAVRMNVSEANRSASRLSAERVQFGFTSSHELETIQAQGRAEAVMGGAPPQRLAADAMTFQFAPGAGAAWAAARLQSVVANGHATLHRQNVDASAQAMQISLDARQQPQSALATGSVALRETLPDSVRTTQCNRLDLQFAAAGNTSVLQQALADGEVEIQQEFRHLHADHARYRPQQGTATFDGHVEGGDAQSLFSAAHAEWQASPDGAERMDASQVAISLIAAPGPAVRPSQPVVVSAQTMQWNQPGGAGKPPLAATAFATTGLGVGRFRGVAVFTGAVRMVQAPNLVRADRLSLDGDTKTLTATGHVTTLLLPASASAVHPANAARAPVSVASGTLDYNTVTRVALYEHNVRMESGTSLVLAPRIQVFLSNTSVTHALASGGVQIRQPGRAGTGAMLAYDVSTGKVQLSGDSPSILDAEQGQIHGDPLTFSLANDEIQVGSKPGSRARGQLTGHQ